tara:strand:- start:64 stop:1065 length:1002 start_codon:yes stop_codon:yes gene_type:complete
MPQSGAVQSLTPIGPLDFLAETAMTGASQMEDMNPLAVLLAGALAPGAYKKLKTTNTPALLKKHGIKASNPLYHNTTVRNAENIIKKGRLGMKINKEMRAMKHDWEGKSIRDISLTRNPEYTKIPGEHKADLDVQIILDKKDISSRGSRIKPYVYNPHYTEEGIKVGSPVFGKTSKWFEAEERVVGDKGISTKNIKAIKLRGSGTWEGDLRSLINNSIYKNIPLLVEPGAEEGVMSLLNVMKPKQKSKALKFIKFSDKKIAKDKTFKKVLFPGRDWGLEEYEGVIKGKKYRIYRSEEDGDFYFGDNYIGDTLEDATDYIKSGFLKQDIEFDKM